MTKSVIVDDRASEGKWPPRLERKVMLKAVWNGARQVTRFLKLRNDAPDYEALQRRTAALEIEVAERRRAESALREEEQRTRFALAAARVGIWDVDLATRGVTWSETMANTFGLTPAEAPGTLEEFLGLIHPDDRPGIDTLFKDALSDHRDYEMEFRAVWPDASVHHVYSRTRILVGADGSPSGMLGVSMDVSERRSLEDQLRQAQKMEAVGQLAGGVAHDFNNLVTAIRGYADLLSDTIAEGDEGHAEVIEIIKASERAGGFTRQLLAFSRKETFEPKRLDLNSLVLDISTMLRRLLSGEDIELALALAPSVAPVRADAGQIGQVLMNLAINSRDAMPNGGRLSIETADVTLDDEYTLTHLVVRPGPYVLLSVSDNGFGMDAATRRRIFEPFFTTKEHGRGTGLGLATVDAIVKRSGGCMSVYSEPGHGTTFKIYLPCAEEE